MSRQETRCHFRRTIAGTSNRPKSCITKSSECLVISFTNCLCHKTFVISRSWQLQWTRFTMVFKCYSKQKTSGKCIVSGQTKSVSCQHDKTRQTTPQYFVELGWTCWTPSTNSYRLRKVKARRVQNARNIFSTLKQGCSKCAWYLCSNLSTSNYTSCSRKSTQITRCDHSSKRELSKSVSPGISSLPDDSGPYWAKKGIKKRAKSNEQHKDYGEKNMTVNDAAQSNDRSSS